MAHKEGLFQKARDAATVSLIWLILVALLQTSHVRLLKEVSGNATSGGDTVVVLPDPQVMKLLSLGFDQLLADCWWLGFIQYFGDTKARLKDKYKYSYEYLNLVTTLDPRFTQPYWFAAFAVGAEQKRPDLAARLIDRGIRANPDNWYLPFIAGVNQYLFAGNEKKAARYYAMASKYPDAPGWLSRQAEILEAELPSLIKRTSTWTAIYESTRDELVRQEARENLINLWVRIYHESPSYPAKRRAKAELERLGFDVERLDTVK